MSDPTHVSPPPPIRVGIGIVRRGDRFLARRRPEGAALAGYWEFPGGKCEPGESPEDATVRECREETGLEVLVTGRRRLLTHRYPHAEVELSYFDAAPLGPVAEPTEDSGFVWVAASDLGTLTFPEANAPVLEELIAEFGGVGSA